MNILNDDPRKDKVSILKDPFTKEAVKCISINIYNEKHYSGKDAIDCRASVQFTNGNTSGQQAFDGYTDLQKLLKDIDTFIKTL